jgi:hypothetical protein
MRKDDLQAIYGDGLGEGEQVKKRMQRKPAGQVPSSL